MVLVYIGFENKNQFSQRRISLRNITLDLLFDLDICEYPNLKRQVLKASGVNM